LARGASWALIREMIRSEYPDGFPRGKVKREGHCFANWSLDREEL